MHNTMNGRARRKNEMRKVVTNIPKSASLLTVKSRRLAIEQLYYEMGSERSLSKLYERVNDNYEKYGSVSSRTLAQWCSNGGWVKKAAAYDAADATNAIVKATQMLDVSTLRFGDTLDAISRLALQKIYDGLLAMSVTTPAQAQQLAKVFVECERVRDRSADPSSPRGKQTTINQTTNNVTINAPTAERARNALDVLHQYEQEFKKPAEVFDAPFTEVKVENSPEEVLKIEDKASEEVIKQRVKDLLDRERENLSLEDLLS